LRRPLTVYGGGTQSRSVQYVDDLIEGVLRLMRSPEDRPVNIGNPVEYSARQVAEMILEISGNSVVPAWPLLGCCDGDLKTHTERLTLWYCRGASID
jgi:nucleoside-diphosphate-sugar epimerase